MWTDGQRARLYFARRAERRPCLFHFAVDLPTHHDDGSFPFFPFNWTYRFYSPISYWDPNRMGREFRWFELGLNVILLSFITVRFVRRRRELPGHARGGDGLAAFEAAPCYRPEAGGSSQG